MILVDMLNQKTVYMRDEINDLDNELLNKYYSEEALQ